MCAPRFRSLQEDASCILVGGVGTVYSKAFACWCMRKAVAFAQHFGELATVPFCS